MRTDNYEIAKDQARKLFLRWDQPRMIKRCALAADGEYLYLPFLGQPFRIDRATGAAENLAEGREANFEEVLSIYDYLCRELPPPGMTGSRKPVHALRYAGQTSPGASSFHQRYADRFQARKDALKAALARIGSPFPIGDIACVFPVFDGFDAVFQFWEGDEEFPPSVRFLWDENTPDYLKFETTFYVMGCFLELLERRIAESEKNN